MFEAIKDVLVRWFLEVDGRWYVFVDPVICSYVGIFVGFILLAIQSAWKECKKESTAKPTPEAKEDCR